MQNTKDVFRSFLVRNAEYDGKLELPVIKTSSQIPTKVITFSKAMARSCKDFDAWLFFMSMIRILNAYGITPELTLKDSKNSKA